jgi:hypothetical protein
LPQAFLENVFFYVFCPFQRLVEEHPEVCVSVCETHHIGVYTKFNVFLGAPFHGFEREGDFLDVEVSWKENDTFGFGVTEIEHVVVGV